jgi:excisionase family DNA binding protein
MLTLQLQITDEQMKSLADMIAERIAGKSETTTRPLTTKEAAARLGVSESTVIRRVHAGEFPRVPGVGRMLIPSAFIQRLSNGETITEGEDAR